jgi:hypothetical protein
VADKTTGMVINLYLLVILKGLKAGAREYNTY